MVKVEEPPKSFDYLDIPGWDDIIHVQPPPTIMEWEMEEHRKRRKKGEKSNLTQRQLNHLAKKRERYLRMKRSPTPEIVKCISKIMTEYDDLEDGLVTAAVAGRLLIKLLPRLMGRFIPCFGWCLLAADVINLFQVMTWLPFFGMSAKRTKETLTERNPLGRKAKLKRLKRMKRVIPTFGEFLEIAQTTDQLFGVGICLGPIMGYCVDAASAVAKGYQQIISPRLMTTYARGFFATQKATMIANVCDEELTDEEHTNAFVSAYMHLKEFKGYLDQFDWNLCCQRFINEAVTAHASMSPSTKYILEDAGEDIEETMRWPIPGTPKTVPLKELVEKLAPVNQKNIHNYNMRTRHTNEGYIASHCLHEFLYDELLLWEGHSPYATEFYRREEDVEYSVTLYDGGSRIKNPPAYTYSQLEKDALNNKILEKSEDELGRIITVMLENEILPQPGTTPEQLQYFFDRVVLGDRMAQAESTPREIFDSYVDAIGWPRRAFPVYPKNASHEFMTNQEEFSESFIDNMYSKGMDLWPRWELMPREAIEYYMRYGLL